MYFKKDAKTLRRIEKIWEKIGALGIEPRFQNYQIQYVGFYPSPPIGRSPFTLNLSHNVLTH